MTIDDIRFIPTRVGQMHFPHYHGTPVLRFIPTRVGQIDVQHLNV